MREDFDGPEPTLREVAAATQAIASPATNGPAKGPTQRIRLRSSLRSVSGAGGTYVHLTHDLAPARVISELKPTACGFVRIGRGFSCSGAVVFPRSIQPDDQPAEFGAGGRNELHADRDLGAIAH